MFVNKHFSNLYIYPTPSPWAGCDTGSIFKQSTTGLNSDFSFSQTDHLNKLKEPSDSDNQHLLYIYIYRERETDRQTDRETFVNE